MGTGAPASPWGVGTLHFRERSLSLHSRSGLGDPWEAARPLRPSVAPPVQRSAWCRGRCRMPTPGLACPRCPQRPCHSPLLSGDRPSARPSFSSQPEGNVGRPRPKERAYETGAIRGALACFARHSESSRRTRREHHPRGHVAAGRRAGPGEEGSRRPPSRRPARCPPGPGPRSNQLSDRV